MGVFDGRGFSCRRVVEQRQPVLEVYHESDGDWQFLCGGNEHEDDSEILILHPAHLVEEDSALEQLADLPLGYVAMRTSPKEPWKREPIGDDEEEELEPSDAIPVYRQMLAERPNDPVVWFDLGLAYKRIRDWNSCVEANSKALEISSSAGDPAWWNLGIAATALRNWDLARKAWRGYGLEIGEGPGPIVCDYGSTPVRLPNDEIVWGPRIDPARVILRNIPFPESGFRWGDIVLHDGAPNGEREVNGTVYSVFDVLERWSPSEIPTLGVDVHCNSIEDSKELIRTFESHGFGAEDWSTNVRYICKDCSEGRPGHNHVPRDPGPKGSFALASPMGAASQLLQEWCSASPSSRRFSKPVPIG